MHLRFGYNEIRYDETSGNDTHSDPHLRIGTRRSENRAADEPQHYQQHSDDRELCPRGARHQVSILLPNVNFPEIQAFQPETSRITVIGSDVEVVH